MERIYVTRHFNYENVLLECATADKRICEREMADAL